MNDKEQEPIHARVREQFGRTAAAYVSSPIHARGDDLAEMLRLALAFRGGNLQGASVLDVATGAGHTALTFAQADALVTATDLTPAMLEVAEAWLREQGVTNVAFVAAPAEALPFADASFDVLTCRIAAHHFADPTAFVREVSRVLRPGGLFLLVDNIAPLDAETARLMNEIERRRDPGHVEAYSVPQWLAWCAEAGLDPVHLWRWHRDKAFADWTGRAEMTPVARRDLETLLVDLSPEQKAYFRVREDGGAVVSLAHEAALLAATKV